jgi:hypothetical protein
VASPCQEGTLLKIASVAMLLAISDTGCWRPLGGSETGPAWGEDTGPAGEATEFGGKPCGTYLRSGIGLIKYFFRKIDQ